MTPERVAAASAAWVWVPDTATTETTDDFMLVRFPPWFTHPLDLVRFSPNRPVEEVVPEVLARARTHDVSHLLWWVKLGAPAGLDERVLALGGTLEETLDVLALDLTSTAPDLSAPSDVEIRWSTDLETERDSQRVQTTVFGDQMPPEDQLVANAARGAADVPAGRGGTLVAYLDRRPVGSAGLNFDGDVARLWGGSVLEEARGRGVYRALLAARLDHARDHGRVMGLVKGRVDTSGPILRRAGFRPFGQERSYVVPL